MGATALSALLLMVCPEQGSLDGTSVVGNGEVSRRPDSAYVTVYVLVDAVLMTDALKKARQQVDELEQAISKEVKPPPKFETELYALGTKTERVWRSDTPATPRPEAVIRVRAAIPPQTDLAAKILDLAVRSNALLEPPQGNMISGRRQSAVVYALKDFAKAETEAMRLANQDATAKAKAVAKAAGLELGELVGVESPCGTSGRMWADDENSDLPTPYYSFSPDTVQVIQSVRLRFAK